jgi:hypothetical protein
MDKAEPYRPKFGFDVRIKPPEEPAPVRTRPCAWAGCTREGDHPAPKSRINVTERSWYCLDHVREYNKNWNFFSGWSDAQVRAYQIDGLTGHRPTWRFGERTAGNGLDEKTRRPPHINFQDPFAFFDGARKKAEAPRNSASVRQAKALEVFQLEQGAGREAIRARYKLLVKRFHPDANEGDRGSEEQLRAVIEAYKTLKSGGFC